MTELQDKTISLNKAIGILLAVVIVVTGAGYLVGKMFFWDKYDTTSVYQRQVEALEEFAKVNPNSKNAKVLLFDRYFGLGEYDKAKEKLDELKKDKALSDNADIDFREALLLRQEGDKEKAMAAVDKSIQKKMFFTSARVLRAQLYVEKKQYDKALEDINLVLRIMPGAADIYLEKAKICLAKGDKKAALESVEQALKMVPDYKEALDLKKQIQ